MQCKLPGISQSRDSSATYAATVAGERVEFNLRDSTRARRLSITVRPGHRPEIVVPRRTPNREIERLLRERELWLQEKLAWAKAEATRPKLYDTADGTLCWLGGEPLQLGVKSAAKARASLRAGVVTASGADSRARTEALLRWHRRTAREQLLASCAEQANRLGIEYGRVSIRDQRTRWGSCSRNGDLSFSWRLSVAPRSILEYVVVHELTHIEHHDHSRRFWSALSDALPGWREPAAWLREHGYDLSSYSPTSR